MASVFICCSCGKDSGTDPGNSAATDSEAKKIAAQTPEKDPVSSSWFDDAVFVGDSVTVRLQYYCDEVPDVLGKAQFLCAASLSYSNAQWDLYDTNAVHPQYKGTTVLAEDCVSVTGAKKVFIMLGMNDIGTYGVDGALKSADELLTKITQKAPDAKIYVQSVTPIVLGMERDILNNYQIRQFGAKMKEYSEKKGYAYLDVYSVMCDSYGYLPLEYCSDPDVMGIHFTSDACAVWADYLKNNV